MAVEGGLAKPRGGARPRGPGVGAYGVGVLDLAEAPDAAGSHLVPDAGVSAQPLVEGLELEYVPGKLAAPVEGGVGPHLVECGGEHGHEQAQQQDDQEQHAVVVEEGEDDEVDELGVGTVEVVLIGRVDRVYRGRVEVDDELPPGHHQVDHRLEGVEEVVELGDNIEGARAGARVVHVHGGPKGEQVKEEEGEEDGHVQLEQALDDLCEHAEALVGDEDHGDEEGELLKDGHAQHRPRDLVAVAVGGGHVGLPGDRQGGDDP